jgi:chemosensory pili system protein ChpA (sensor histidine kinase/response regulator)
VLTSPNGPPTVLVVDDDAAVAQTFARILQLGGYGVTTALDAATALRQVERIRPDIVLLDLRMPLVDGLEFLRALRAHELERHTPVAIITGDYSLDDRLEHELRVLDASLYYKPIWFDDLLVITRQLLDKAH